MCEYGYQLYKEGRQELTKNRRSPDRLNFLLRGRQVGLAFGAALLTTQPTARADDEKSYPGAVAVVVHDPATTVTLGGSVAYDSVNGRVRNSSTVHWLSVGVSTLRDVFAVATELETVVVWVYDPSIPHNSTCDMRAVAESGAVVDNEVRTSVGSTGVQQLSFSPMSSDTDILLHCDIPPAINGTVAGQSGVTSIRWVEQE